MPNTLLHILITYRYLALFPLAFFEGPIVALAVGFLLSLGYFKVLPAFGIMILGDLIPDSVYYYLGRFGNQRKLIEKYRSSLKAVSLDFEFVEKLWINHPRKMMIFGKLAYGLSIPFLISAGLARVQFRKFIIYAVPVTIFQYGVIMGIGYYVGSSYLLAAQYVHLFYYFMAFAVLLFAGAYFGLTRYIRGLVAKWRKGDND
ncbi:MAG: hypothetical protein HY220_03890 [Candidatus Sungbacteria bacterium]|uniref:DedA family protein n=1 Tax=Candidatus Sungiibacteriota bacterium TaxID=2750080 RepID=A0A9D6QVU0_9BACT|nr:hypothetical protein [Candidatus Sungbacteria bacterium]